MERKNLTDFLNLKPAQNKFNSKMKNEKETGFSLNNYLTQFKFVETNKSKLKNINSPNKTFVKNIKVSNYEIKRYINEFWTSKQRQASSIHEISYRARFKPQLPRFFIKLFTDPKDIIYDPFAGRGTTGIEAGILHRNVILNDINPLSKILSEPRFSPPNDDEIQNRLNTMEFNYDNSSEIDLSMFYHKKTEAEIVSLKLYLENRKKDGIEDSIDKWIRMVTTNRLSGHSPGFLSVYTLPPNQAVSPESQIKINNKRNQIPDYRNTKKIILKKSKSLLSKLNLNESERLKRVGKKALFLTNDARYTPEIHNESVSLIITSPPFLDVVQYSKDNWLRCWFNSIDDKEIAENITMSKTVKDWSAFMSSVFKEFHRIIGIGGRIAFEVGEVRKGKVRLDEEIVPLGIESGFKCNGILINLQKFTKTSNIWGIKNNYFGTNTNRIVIFTKS